MRPNLHHMCMKVVPVWKQNFKVIGRVVRVLWSEMQACVVAGRIASINFHLHGSIGKQCDSYLVLALADTEVEIFQLLASKTHRVKLQLFFVYMCIASEKASF